MGAVFRAWDPRLERTIALKLLLRGNDDGAQLRHEAKALAKLEHPNVVTIYDVGHDERGDYVAMELVDGPTLGTWLETHANATARAIVELFVQAGRGLAAAHDVGVVHRDFKPDNVIVGIDGRVRVVDFGIARLHDDADLHPHAGTPNFMAPEQRRGDRVDARTDQFAFCLALRRALEDIDASDTSISRAQRAAIDRGLEDDPAARWPTMDALLSAVEPPTPKGRRWILAGLVGMVGAAAATSAFQESAASCPSPNTDAVTAWNETDRPALVDRLAATSLAGTPELLRRLDAMVDDWSGARVEACELVHASDPELAHAGGRRLQCLDLVADGIAAFSRDLIGRDDEALSRAGLALDVVRTPSECSPGQNTLVSEVPDRELLLEIQAGRVARNLHDFDNAASILAAAYERATSAGHHRLAATAALSLSSQDNDELEEQRTWAGRALGSAESARDIDLMVMGWIRLSYAELASTPRGPWEETLEHAVRLAESGLLRASTRGRLEDARASGLARRGQHEAALRHYDAAIDAFSSIGQRASAGATHCDRAQAFAALGDMERALDDVDNCLDILGAELGRTHPALLVRLGIGMRLSMVANDFDRTLALAEQAIAAGRHKRSRARAHIAPYLYAAGALTERSEFDRALEFLDDGLALAETLGDPDAEASMHAQFGATLSEKDDCAAALEHFDLALDLRKFKTGAEVTFGISYLNRAECKAKLGDADGAMNDVEQAWAVLDLAESSTLRLSLVRLDGKISLYAGNLDRAIEKLADVEEHATDVGMAPPELGYALYLRARAELARGDAARARAYVGRAREAYEGHTEPTNRYKEFVAWAEALERDALSPSASR
jgi:tetratricopeptide (TPR) repeat protein